MTASQNDELLVILRRRGRAGITQLEAYEILRSTRLGARVFDLKAANHNILDEWVTVPSGKRVKRYWLADAPAVTTGEQTDLGMAS